MWDYPANWFQEEIKIVVFVFNSDILHEFKAVHIEKSR